MKDENSYEAIKEIFTQYLVDNHHRKTPERFAILERIFSYKGHFNADVLYNVLKDEYRVSLATVYNTFELLVGAKLIVKYQIGKQYAQYEKTFGDKTHHYLVCRNCGKVKEFSDKSIRVPIQSKVFTHFEMAHYTLLLYGLCSKCKEKLHEIDIL